jgi:VanZ family protein
MSPSDSETRLKRSSLAGLVAYWCFLFVATHTPVVPSLPLASSDKLVHAIAYCGLAFLLAFAWWLRWPLGWRGYLAIFAILLAYGAFDEITQIPVGRRADVVDWLADAAGALAGLAVFAAARTIVRPRG